MRHCDLCNVEIFTTEAVIIRLEEMQQAVRAGFNPFKTPGINILSFGAMLSIDDELVYQNWRRRVLADNTDWRLCPYCAEAFRDANVPKQVPDRAISRKASVVSKIVGQHYEAAMIYFNMGDWDECIAKLTNAIELNPKFAEGYFWRAAAYFSKAIGQGIEGLPLNQIIPNCEKSIANYSKTIELDPANAKAYINRSGVYYSLRRDEDATRDVRKAAEIDPQGIKGQQMVFSEGIRKRIAG